MFEFGSRKFENIKEPKSSQSLYDCEFDSTQLDIGYKSIIFAIITKNENINLKN